MAFARRAIPPRGREFSPSPSRACSHALGGGGLRCRCLSPPGPTAGAGHPHRHPGRDRLWVCGPRPLGWAGASFTRHPRHPGGPPRPVCWPLFFPAPSRGTAPGRICGKGRVGRRHRRGWRIGPYTLAGWPGIKARPCFLELVRAHRLIGRGRNCGLAEHHAPRLDGRAFNASRDLGPPFPRADSPYEPLCTDAAPPNRESSRSRPSSGGSSEIGEILGAAETGSRNPLNPGPTDPKAIYVFPTRCKVLYINN